MRLAWAQQIPQPPGLINRARCKYRYCCASFFFFFILALFSVQQRQNVATLSCKHNWRAQRQKPFGDNIRFIGSMPIPNAIRNRHCAKLTAIGEKKAATESIPLLFQYLYSPYAHPFLVLSLDYIISRTNERIIMVATKERRMAKVRSDTNDTNRFSHLRQISW